jgi:pSer/pThr/pTyr-binding forkhead associated (FHA) protein
VKCKSCGAGVDLTMSSCPACGAQLELARLTGILGVVCRACDAYNEPGAATCIACGKPIGTTTSTSSATSTSTAPPPPGAPIVHSFQKPTAGAATRFVPSVLRPSAQSPRAPAPESPALTPIPLVRRCPRCGAEARQGRFCSQCGQALGARGTQVVTNAGVPGRSAPQVPGTVAPGRAKLVLDRGGGESATFALDAESVDVGRSGGAIAFPDDPCLAPHHATFFYRDGALYVRDVGAPGGIYLRLRGLSVPLRAGDPFVVGERLLRYAGPLPAAPEGPPDGTRRLGAPRPLAPAVVVEEWLEGGAAGRAFVRAGPSVTIGRIGCTVNLGDDRHLSQAHAEIAVDQQGTARLRDLGSSNGTYVRVPPRAERELRDGDSVRIGNEVLRVAVAE